eukprot:g48225.t1
MVNNSDVAVDKVKFGAVLYGTNPQTVFQLDQFTNKADISKAIYEMNPMGGNTFTAKALDFASGLLDPLEGGRKLFGVPQFLLVITDGESTDRDDLNSVVDVIRDKGINIYTVGVANANQAELLQISGSPENSFYEQDFEDLERSINTISQKFCHDSKPDCDVHEADIVFLIDGSSSISPSDFSRMKDFLKYVVRMFTVGQTNVQFGIAQYSSKQTTIFHLNELSVQSEIFDRIDKITQLFGGTITGEALEFVMDFFQTSAGSRKLEGVPQYLLVVTDGLSQDFVAAPANNLRKENINVFAVGVGEANDNELIQISGAPERKIYIENFDELDTIKRRIVRHLCTPLAEGPVADVVFMVDTQDTQNIQVLKMIQNFIMGSIAQLNIGLDKYRIGFAQFGKDVKTEFLLKHSAVCLSNLVADIVYLVDESGSIGEENFELMRNFLVRVISALEVGPDKVQVGLIQYSDNATPQFYLDTYQTKADVINHIKGIPYKKGRTNTGAAIDYMMHNYFIERRGSRRRNGIPQIAVVITDGVSTDEVTGPAKALRRHGVIVYALGIKDATVDELKSIASYPPKKYVSTITDFDQLKSVESRNQVKICKEIIDIISVKPHEDELLEQGCVETEEADIFFLIDGSGSIYAHNFEEIKTFLSDIVKLFSIGANQVRVGVVQYSDRVQPEFEITQYTSKVELVGAIERIGQIGGDTKTGNALTYMTTYLDRARQSRKTEVQRLLITITDGESHDNPSVTVVMNVLIVAYAQRSLIVWPFPYLDRIELALVVLLPLSMKRMSLLSPVAFNILYMGIQEHT